MPPSCSGTIPPLGTDTMLRLDNYGSIQGAGGAANGGGGGPALHVQHPTSIHNAGTIYAGGGGGGAGGAGGTGGQGYYTTNNYSSWMYNRTSYPQYLCEYTSIYNTTNLYWNQYSGVFASYTGSPRAFTVGGYTYECGTMMSSEAFGGGGMVYRYQIRQYSTSVTYTSGGAGGNGGSGLGYGQAAAAGSGGAAGAFGGTNAGRGGTGGTGGSGGGWGAYGGTGNTGATGAAGNYTGGYAGTAGGGGGLPGSYVVGNGNVTWLNLGFVAGTVQ